MLRTCIHKKCGTKYCKVLIELLLTEQEGKILLTCIDTNNEGEGLY